MAIARLSMKVGRGGQACPHAAYIAREGKYAHRLEQGLHGHVHLAADVDALVQRAVPHVDRCLRIGIRNPMVQRR